MKVCLVSHGDPAGQFYLLAKYLNTLDGWDARDLRFEQNYIGYPAGTVLHDITPEDSKTLLEWIGDGRDLLWIIAGFSPAMLHTHRHHPIFSFMLGDKAVNVQLTKDNHLIKLHGTDAVLHRDSLLVYGVRYGWEHLIGSPDPRIWKAVPCVPWVPPMVDKTEMDNALTNHIDTLLPGGVLRPSSNQIVVNHSATDRRTKHTYLLSHAIRLLRDKGIDAYADITQQASWGESLWHKSVCDVYFDQCFAGMYGVSAVEALLLGKPVICGISPMVKSWLIGTGVPMGDLLPLAYPFYEATTADEVAEQMVHAEPNPKRKEWAVRVHGPDTVGKQWKALLEGVHGQ